MEFLLRLPGLLMAIIIHEVSHGYMAYKLGDTTAKDQGRLSLNPINHIDPVGFIFMLVFRIGWAKPVPIDSRYFKDRKKGILLVSLAGPVSNFITAIVLTFILIFNIVNPFFYSETIGYMLQLGVWYNIMLGTFNLLPLPPLDGSKVLASLLPDEIEYFFYKYEKYFYMVFIILIITNVINRILSPILLAEIRLLNKFIYSIVINFA